MDCIKRVGNVRSKIPLLLFLAVLIQSSVLLLCGSYSSLWREIDATAIVDEVVDGDSFKAFPVGRVRMAAINSSENDERAKNYLESLIQDKLVHLDLYGTGGVFDKNGSLICTTIYVRHNETHLTNVGKALIDEGLANASNDHNKFDSGNWTLHVYYPTKDVNYQEMLLNFNTQELVSHSAALFAASIASFTFITNLIKRASKRGAYSRMSFVIFSGILLGTTIFIGFRILYYGYRASVTIAFPLPSEEYPNLQVYASHVEDYYLRGNYSRANYYNISFPFSALVELNKGLHLRNPFGGFWLSMDLGWLTANVVLWTFTDIPFRRPWRRLFCILLLAVSIVYIFTTILLGYLKIDPLNFRLLGYVALGATCLFSYLLIMDDGTIDTILRFILHSYVQLLAQFS